MGGLQERYEAFIRSFGPIAERISERDLDEHEALVVRTAVI
ncbi:hypothetical protein, partial [Pseudonocardia sp.]